MTSFKQPELIITGLGVTSAIGQGKMEFISALLEGHHVFDVMKRPGRQKGTAFLGAEIPSLFLPEQLSKRLLRTASLSGQVALLTLQEAWNEANLDNVDPRRIGLVVGGSNFQQRELLQTYESYRDQLDFIRPTYSLAFMDSDICGLCTEQFGIGGLAYTIGGASASGQVAIIQAIQEVLSGRVDVCIAMGALMDLSYMELQALQSLGAMGSIRYANDPASACRPFDVGRDGFIYGESCGVIVIEKAETALTRQVNPYAILSGWSLVMDGNRNPDPSYEGEVCVIQEALKQAKMSPSDIDYINPHGTGSGIGDEIELRALYDCQLPHAYLNATKSITGHGLSSAGAVEIITTILQMRESRLHPTRNLEEPIHSSFNWVRNQSVPHVINNAINLSIGFGGINTAICLQRI
ncbi:beta-ketoacyl synthase N-terminal-like domain-containing protein [Priestia megaterium]|uniref:beta-ketoacyl synthase N-terminal-like domain-containing protein n=1 Tax=Priestia megaterium TaxID=1404 RepID=UPI0012D95377|nr:beta-ketoacyl synthase N-terminal-like domain-containing protein [Priestia megaterium]MUL34707.1 Polyketide biosynthesis malonyl-ACP decarboxylase PksF [Priestia megaterium]